MQVAVVGAGIGGLSAVWLLNEHSDHGVRLFEARDYVGGHTNTVDFNRSPASERCPVDTGFIVFNRLTYPNFCQFLDILGIKYIPSSMSLSVRRAAGPAYEWSANGISSLFSGVSGWQERISQLRMVWDIVRFNHLAGDVLSLREEDDLSVGQYLIENNYSDSFRRNYLLPMIASIWSTPANKAALLFPMKTLIRFMANHHLLQIINQPQWLTIKGGAKTYVDRILSRLDQDRCSMSTPIDSLFYDQSGKVFLRCQSGQRFGPFDHVIFGCHADQARNILERSDCGEIFKKQVSILSKFQFNKNHAVLHSDTSLMPRNREIWTSWNYLVTRPNSYQELKQPSAWPVESTVSLTYWMNLLQSVPEGKFGPVFVTLNPSQAIDPRLVRGKWDYDHPMYTAQSVKAQKQMKDIQAQNRVSFVGAWMNYGFHEDGLSSSLKLLCQEQAEIFGVRSPIKLKIHCEKLEPVGWGLRILLTLGQRWIEALCLGWYLIIQLLSPVRRKLKIT